MRDSVGIKIKELIVHAINLKQADGFILSECCIPLNTGDVVIDKLTDYFGTHIKKSLGDSATKAARFMGTRSTSLEEVPNLCRAVLRSETDIVTASKELAKKLKAIIEKDKRIASGNLVMCLYEAENYPGQHYIALMKMDPSDVFRQRTETDDKNRRFVTFDIENSVMPTTQEKLQKCAFIRLASDDYDMMLLDRQIQEKVAQFFTQDFLQAELAFDDLERTTQFYRGIISVIDDIKVELPSEKTSLLFSMSRNVIKQNTVNIDQWIGSLDLNENHKEKFVKKLSGLPDREFSIDQSFHTKLGHKTKYRGDYDLLISINSEDREEVIQEKAPENPGDPWIITIRTKEWHQDT